MTLLSDTIRRLRRRLGDYNGDVYTDAVLQDAILDYMQDTVTPQNGTTYSVVDVEGISYLDPSPGNLETIVVLGTALALITGEASSAARDAISMDGPSGRVNLQRPGELLLDLLKDLQADYENALLSTTLFSPTPSYVNMAEIEEAFTEEATS